MAKIDGYMSSFCSICKSNSCFLKNSMRLTRRDTSMNWAWPLIFFIPAQNSWWGAHVWICGDTPSSKGTECDVASAVLTSFFTRTKKKNSEPTLSWDSKRSHNLYRVTFQLTYCSKARVTVYKHDQCINVNGDNSQNGGWPNTNLIQWRKVVNKVNGM